MNDATSVANEFIRVAAGKQQSLTPLQLMKLVYIAHGWSLAIRQQPLIREEIQAWRYGPVIPHLYHLIKRWGRGAISETLNSGYTRTPPHITSTEVRSFINEVFERYGWLSGPALSNLTHMPGTPWHRTFVDGQNRRISQALIAEHYRELLNRAGQRQAH